MDGSVPALLAEWESFYVIVGSSVLEDWVFHAVLPVVAYAGLVAAAAALLPLFVGIHNAWDAMTFVAVSKQAENQVRNRDLSEE